MCFLGYTGLLPGYGFKYSSFESKRRIHPKYLKGVFVFYLHGVTTITTIINKILEKKKHKIALLIATTPPLYTFL